MTKGDLNGFLVLNRPIKPVALGLAILMFTLTWFNIFDIGLFRDDPLGDVVAVLSFGSFTMFMIGWFGSQQWAVEWALLSAAVVYAIRGSFLLFTFGISNEGFWLSLGTGVISAGAFLLERFDTHPKKTSYVYVEDA